MNNRFYKALFLFACIAMLAFAGLAHAADADSQDADGLFDGTNPLFVPAVARIGSQGQVVVPEGYVYFGKEDSIILLERMENLINGRELGMLMPEDFSWFLSFEYDDSGYVSDSGDDAEIDADSILDSFREGVKESNKEKAARGWSTTEVVGWSVKPHYNSATKNLEWGITFRSDGENFDNYNVRLLGREGVMEVVLVGDAESYDKAMADSQKVLEGYSFIEGKTYGEYRQGDKMAGYGLAALIAGGTLAAAAKSGFLAKFLKPILVGLAAVGAFILNLFRRKKKDD